MKLMEVRRILKKAILGYSNLLYPVVNLHRERQHPIVDVEKRSRIPFFISFDLDYSKDIKSIPVLLEKLRSRKIRTSFACVGRFIEMHPMEHHAILEDGHEILNHTYSHPDNDEINPHQTYRQLTPEEQFEEIWRMQEVSAKFLNYKPIGFRLPHFGNVVTVDMVNLYLNLKRLGMLYDTSLLKFNIPRGNEDIFETEVQGITEFSISTCPFHPFAACDSWHVYRANRHVYRWIHKSKTFEITFRRLIDECYQRQEMINVYLDPMDVIAEGSLDRVLDYAMGFCDFYAYEDFFKQEEISISETPGFAGNFQKSIDLAQ